MLLGVAIIIGVPLAFLALCGLAACMLSSRISRAEEREASYRPNDEVSNVHHALFGRMVGK